MSYLETFADILKDPSQFNLIVNGVMKADEDDIPQWGNFLEVRPTETFNFKAYTGVINAVPAGTVVSKNSKAPIRERRSLGQVYGEISVIKDEWQMDSQMMEEFLQVQNKYGGQVNDPILGENAVNRILAYLYPDLKMATFAPHNRIDQMVMQGASTGIINITAANNPDGLVFQVDLGITKKYGTRGAVWTTPATATPIADLRYAILAGRAVGARYRYIRMNETTFNRMVATTEVKNIFTNVSQTNGNIKSDYSGGLIGLSEVNQYFNLKGLPIIEIVDKVITTADGSVVTPFEDGKVCLSYAQQVGKLYLKDPLEVARPIPNISYANYEGNMIRKWRDHNAEYTGYEMDAFPVFDNVENMALLNTDNVSTWS